MESSNSMRMFIRAFMVLLFPTFQNGDGHFFENAGPHLIEDYMNINNHEQEHNGDDTIAAEQNVQMNVPDNVSDDWFEVEIEPDVKSCMALNRVEDEVMISDQNQQLAILNTQRFGKALVIDGHVQSSEMDEFIYHESLVHPALLIHDEPKTVFIMGGGGRSVAREVLKHKNIEKVIMCDIDWQVVNLCREHMTIDNENFNDQRFQIVYNDAKDELDRSREKFDVIIGDLTHPTESRPSSNLYTESFYELVVKPKLNDKGIFITQAGPAGIFSHKNAFSPIYNTLKQIFTYVIAYTAQIPSFGDSYGWILASDKPINIDIEQLNNRIGERIIGELYYLDGHVIAASTVFNKTLKTSLMNEVFVITEENVRFVQGRDVGPV